MAETAALLDDEVLPERPLRQRVLPLPYALRFLLATDPDALLLALGALTTPFWSLFDQKASTWVLQGKR